MKRYIDADKLKVAIERRRLSNRYIDTEGYEAELFEIINSLQQEQPEVDLEKEIYTCFEKYTKDAFGIPIEGRITKFEVEEIAHHFYELGLNARKEK